MYILEVGTIISMICIIMFVKFFPRINVVIKDSPIYIESLVSLDDIPITFQDAQKSMQSIVKKIPPAAIYIPVDYDVYLEDIIVEDLELSVDEDFGQNTDTKDSSEGPLAFSSLPYIPRQIVEVIPANIEDIDGKIKLSLLIDKKGEVKKHKILMNSLTDTSYLKFILDAVYKSRWMPINFDGESVEYWFEKTYSFNN